MLSMPNLTILLNYMGADLCLHNLSEMGTQMPDSCDSKPFQAQMVPSLTRCFCSVSCSAPRVSPFPWNSTGDICRKRNLNCSNSHGNRIILLPGSTHSLLRTKPFSWQFQVSCLQLEQAIATAECSNPRCVC